jgi:hypothetical protein
MYLYAACINQRMKETSNLIINQSLFIFIFLHQCKKIVLVTESKEKGMAMFSSDLVNSETVH